jgi:sensor histidine kinase YesM
MIMTGQALTIFLWHCAIVYVLIHLVLSIIVYHNTQNRIFKIYAWYVGLVFTFLVLRNYYGINYKSNDVLYLYAYYIQVIYLCVYIHFGIHFLKLYQYKPQLVKGVYAYIYTMATLSTLLFIAAVMKALPVTITHTFYFYFFFPIHALLSVYLFLVLAKLPALPQKKHFIAGSISYFALGSLAIASSVQPPTWTWFAPMQLFYLAIIVECTFFALGLGQRLAMLHRSNLKAERERHERALLESQLAVLENKVLKSQINSHFLFNVLNSIKALMIENERTQAIHYLNQFAKLIRRILEGSKNERHSLEDELQTLSWYMDIEKIRFQEPIAMELQVQTSVPLRHIDFPPLLLQPLVENALWHGLRDAAPPKWLRIKIEDVSDYLCIYVEDNGIGIAESQRLKNHHPYTSMGMQLIQDRIKQHNQQPHMLPLEVSWTEGAHGIGTLVTIKIDLTNGN